MGKSSAVAPTASVDKVATGIRGLDDVLQGGIPAHRTTLLQGGPGCGKSLIALQLLCAGARRGDAGIYITFEEQAEAVRQNAASIGLDVAALEAEGKLLLLAPKVDHRALRTGDFDISALFAIIDGKAEQMKASRLAIDAVDVLLSLYEDERRERRELHSLHSWLSDSRFTTILTVKARQRDTLVGHYEFLDYLADCAIQLDNRVTEQIATRRLRVLKCRGSGFGRNEYPFVISEDGVELVPITSAELKHSELGPHVSSGHPRLDEILGGGYRQSSSVLLTGPTGTGKSTLAATFALSACGRGERVLYLNFEESEDAMLSCMLSPGLDLRPYVDNDSLRIVATLPESLGAEEHLLRSLSAIRDFDPKHVILDAVSSCDRMGSQRAAFDYLMRLIHACKERGATTLLINQTLGMADVQQISGLNISSVVDAVLCLDYIRSGGEINRTLLALKSRGSRHSNQYREFTITDQGVEFADIYAGEGTVLTGLARLEREANERAMRALKLQEIERKEAEVELIRARMQAEIVQKEAELNAAESDLDRLREALSLRAEENALRATRRDRRGQEQPESSPVEEVSKEGGRP